MKLPGLKFLGLTILAVLLSSTLAQTLTIAVSAQPDTLDPQATSATSSFQTTKSLYDTLVEVNQASEIIPALAADWEISEDGLSWTFHLRDDVRFHNGDELTSNDVRATLERAQDTEFASPKAKEYETIERILTPDEHTVVLELTQPTPALLAGLASGWSAILPASLIAADHDFGNDPVGTGPFKLERWVRDSYLELTRNDGYYQGAPDIAGVMIRFVTDSSVRYQGLLAGEFDIIDLPAAVDVPLIESNPKLAMSIGNRSTVIVAAMNTRRAPFDDVRVRQALNYAVDKDVINEVAYNKAVPTGSFMEPSSPWMPDDIKPYPHDPEKARALLAEAGYADGFAFDLALPQSYDPHITAGQIIQNQLAEYGITANIRIVEWGVWLSEVYGGPHDYDVTVVGHTGKLDPIGRLGGYVKDTNYVGFSTPALTEVLELAAVTSNYDDRKELYAAALRILHDAAPWIYLGAASEEDVAHQANVSGFWVTPLLGTYDYRSVTID
jgi:peptide/nickel transport system substrate-binding protein